MLTGLVYVIERSRAFLVKWKGAVTRAQRERERERERIRGVAEDAI